MKRYYAFEWENGAPWDSRTGSWQDGRVFEFATKQARDLWVRQGPSNPGAAFERTVISAKEANRLWRLAMDELVETMK